MKTVNEDRPRPRRRPGWLGLAGLMLAALLAVAIEGSGESEEAAAPGPAAEPILEPAPEIYREVLDDPRITGSLVWEGVWAEGGGARPYPKWDAARRSELHRALAARERSEGGTPDGPPAVEEGRWVSDEDAWRVFLDHASHALWLEAHGALPWSLRSMTADQLALLLDGRHLLTRDDGRTRYAFGVAGEVTDWDPDRAFAFLRERELLRPTQEETVYAVADWVRRSVRPLAEGEEAAVAYAGSFEYPGPPPVDRILRASGPEPPARAAEARSHAVADCHGLSGLFAAVLRSANIPVAVALSRFARPGGTISLHSRVELPTVGRGLAHSAELYAPLSLPSGNAIPTSALFPTLGWIRDHVDRPRRFECAGTACHREAEQALYNTARRLIGLAATHLPDGLLIDRAQDPSAEQPPERLYELLAEGCRRFDGGRFVRPLFEDAERREIARRADEEIARAGGGDWAKGAETVRRRWETFLENR